MKRERWWQVLCDPLCPLWLRFTKLRTGNRDLRTGSKPSSRNLLAEGWSRVAHQRRKSYAASRPSVGSAGTYGKVVVGFDVTDSLPIPRLMGLFAAMENMTFGALSMSDRPFHSANPNAARVPTSYGSVCRRSTRHNGSIEKSLINDFYPSPAAAPYNTSSPV
jgi:hypothetical protein